MTIRGTATVNGAGSHWFNLNLYLGGTANETGGVGTLNVENQGNVYVGNNTPSIPGALFISDSGTNGNLVAKNGSTINSRDAYIGYGTIYSGVVDLSGTGTEWNVLGDLHVGFNGSGSLNISDNARVDAQNTFVNEDSEIIMDSGQFDVGNMTNEGLLHFIDGVNEVSGSVLNDVELLGNLSRFVEDGTNVVVARIRYQSTNPRQQFSSNTDLFTWGFAD